MKTILMMAALTLASAQALASQARVDALSNSPQIADTTKIFAKPDTVTKMGEWTTFEFGTPGTAATASTASGGFVRSSGDAAWGAYLGRKSPATIRDIDLNFDGDTTDANETSPLGVENPFNVFYGSKAGDMNWGVGLYYSNSDKKTTSLKQSVMGVTAGFSGAAWDAHVAMGLGNKSENNATAGSEVALSGKTTAEIGGGYWMDSMYLFGTYNMSGAKHETGTTADWDVDMTNIKLGVVNTHKKDGTDFFYGAAINTADRKSVV